MRRRVAMSKQMVTKQSWDTFRESGLLFYVNMILHVFGWSIVVEIDNDNKVTSCFPARVKYRGFSDDVQDRGYKKITNYMKNNINSLMDDMDGDSNDKSE